MNIAITSDSTCDLSEALLRENEITLLPLTVTLGDKAYKDGIGITPKDIFAYVDKTGDLPKTAAPSVSDYEEFFRPFVEEGKEVIHFNISSKASGSYGFAVTAAKAFGGKVHVVDSHALSTGQGLLVMKACDLRKEGMSAQKIAETILFYSRYARLPLQGRKVFRTLLLRFAGAVHSSHDRDERGHAVSEKEVYGQDDPLPEKLHSGPCGRV